jgi:phosphatidyl-myo-inositol alpha-mannosyltransferase
MKIAIFTPYNIFKAGGVQEHVHYQAQILREHGHDVTILTPRPRNITEEEAPEGVVFLGSSTRIKAPHATSADVSATIDSDAIDAELDKGYDIIHVHEPLVPIAARQVLVRAEGRALRVGTFHAALPGNTLGKSLVTTYKTYARNVLPHVDVITAVSPAAIGYIDAYTELPIHYIPNGFHKASYPDRKVTRDQNMIVFMGRLEKRKGARQAIRAFALLKRDKPEATLKIAGDGPLRGQLEVYVRDKEINGVEFLGHVSDEEKFVLLSKCGVYTSPALYGESFGIVLVEAMASGAPIVAHNNDGYKWVLKETGRLSLVDCTDTVAYADRLRLLLEDNNLRELWQNWAKGYVKQFDYERVISSYEELYADHLKRDTL